MACEFPVFAAPPPLSGDGGAVQLARARRAAAAAEEERDAAREALRALRANAKKCVVALRGAQAAAASERRLARAQLERVSQFERAFTQVPRPVVVVWAIQY